LPVSYAGAAAAIIPVPGSLEPGCHRALSPSVPPARPVALGAVPKTVYGLIAGCCVGSQFAHWPNL